MQHAIINPMKCMSAIKDRIGRPVYQLENHLSQPLYPHGVSTGEIIGLTPTAGPTLSCAVATIVLSPAVYLFLSSDDPFTLHSLHIVIPCAIYLLFYDYSPYWGLNLVLPGLFAYLCGIQVTQFHLLAQVVHQLVEPRVVD
ncbi:Na+/H+ antiporter [Dorcoceras hygrometricum]|uniref:Na+/H+ antiporter n=1 Tax=Dorcoceras hygrometricum TaxID=472368 RepID=A0A2Z7AB94_9LAMI|nr:Na+/H+ antiporter [Dorcoceras hygrometricum]